MIHGARQTLGAIPAAHFNPFSLAESQRAETHGYVLVSYYPEYSLPFCDLLFFKGPGVYEYIAIDEEHRRQIDSATARKHFTEDLHPHTTLVCLFLAEEFLTHQLLATVHLEPAMKLSVIMVRRRQVRSLLRLVPAGSMLAERNDFSSKPPVFEFRELDTAAPDMGFRLGFRHGTCLLYGSRTPVCIRSGDAPALPVSAPPELPVVASRHYEELEESKNVEKVEVDHQRNAATPTMATPISVLVQERR